MKKILIIEDDRELCDELKEILEDEGFYVKAIFNGLQGKKELSGEKYDILLLDIKIPDMNGLDILRYLSDSGNGIPAIVLTGRPGHNELLKQEGRNTNEEERLLSRAFRVINKPFDIETLISTIKETYASA